MDDKNKQAKKLESMKKKNIETLLVSGYLASHTKMYSIHFWFLTFALSNLPFATPVRRHERVQTLINLSVINIDKHESLFWTTFHTFKFFFQKYEVSLISLKSSKTNLVKGCKLVWYRIGEF